MSALAANVCLNSNYSTIAKDVHKAYNKKSDVVHSFNCIICINSHQLKITIFSLCQFIRVRFCKPFIAIHMCELTAYVHYYGFIFTFLYSILVLCRRFFAYVSYIHFAKIGKWSWILKLKFQHLLNYVVEKRFECTSFRHEEGRAMGLKKYYSKDQIQYTFTLK